MMEQACVTGCVTGSNRQPSAAFYVLNYLPWQDVDLQLQKTRIPLNR